MVLDPFSTFSLEKIMAGKRSHVNEWMRFLNAIPQPIFALNEEGILIFLNRACAEWLEIPPDLLLGKRTAYHVPPDPTSLEALVAGLSPPPKVSEGKPVFAQIEVVAYHQFVEPDTPTPNPSEESESETLLTPATSSEVEILPDFREIPPESPPKRLSASQQLQAFPPIPRQPPSLTSSQRWVTKYRNATFFPFGSEDHYQGCLAILESEDGSAPETDRTGSIGQEPTAEELHSAIRRFRKEAAGRFAAEHLIGISPAMQLARNQVTAAAACRTNVNISGPTGSGRQRLATTIHYATPASETSAGGRGGFIPLDCSILPSEMILSSLSTIIRSGRPDETGELSGPSTLIIRQIDELPEELQGEVLSLFGKRPVPFRVISISSQPLGELAARGKFRADLAAQLSTISIQLPPLSERREDLPFLAQIFLEERNRRQSKQVGGFSPQTLDRLDAYSWPGNLDELVEVVFHAHQHAQGAEIIHDDLPPRLFWAQQAATHPRRTEETIELDEFLQRVERELIRRALARSKGNKAKAARLLGLTRPRLYRKMVLLGLEESPG